MKYEVNPLNVLPIDFDLASDSIRETYVRELKEVDTPDKLLAFAKRWAPLWQLKISLMATSRTEQSIIDQSFDLVEILGCIAANRSGLCEHLEAEDECVSADFLAPVPLLVADTVARQFKVPTNAALFQLVRGAQMKEEEEL